MSSRLLRVAVVILAASLLVVPGAALAAENSGSGPEDAIAEYGAWRTLEAGQSQWYKFGYDGEEGQIAVMVDAKPSDGVSFAVVTPEQARIWRETGDLEACGCGGSDEFVSADLSWSGSFNTPGDYYVLVKHSGIHATPSDYKVTVEGKGVIAPAAAAPAAAPAPAPAAEAAEAAPPDVSDWMGMPSGSSHWVSFLYDGKDSQIHVYLDAEPEQNVNFSVWTPEQARLFGLGEDVEPVGRGSENKHDQGDKSWSGSFTSPGTYYIRIDHAGTGTSYCKLAVTGEDVVF